MAVVPGTPAVDPLLVDVRAASALLGVCPRTVATMTSGGELPHVRVGRRVLYSPDALRGWVAGRMVQPAPTSSR